MKTHYIRYIQLAIKSVFTLLMFFLSSSSFSQVVEPDPEPTQTGSDLGRINLGNPPSIVDAYTYDPVTDKYIFSSTVLRF